MKITIAGAGRVGKTIAENLVKEKHDITVVDSSAAKIEKISNLLDVMPVVGDATSAQVLLDVEADKSDLMIAVTDSDVVNLLICIVAKKIGISKTIARIREPIYAQTINLIKNDMGLSFVVNPERETAQDIFKTLLFKGASQVETFAKGSNEMITFVVKENNPIAGLKVRDISKFAGRKILICAIKREAEIFIPDADTVISENDTLSFVASRPDAVHLFRKMKYETGKISDLTIIGGGKLSFYLANMAVANNIPVKIIEINPKLCNELDDAIPTADIMCGDGTDVSVLEECEVFNSSAVVTATESDEKNVLISMYIARQYPDIKVITKIKKTDFEDMLFGIDIGNVYNPQYIAADRIITYIKAMQETEGSEVRSMCHVIDNKVEVLEFKIENNAPNTGIPFQNIRFRKNVLVASITRYGGKALQSFIPGGSDTIEVGDTVLVVTTDSDIGSFGEIFA